MAGGDFSFVQEGREDMNKKGGPTALVRWRIGGGGLLSVKRELWLFA